MNWAGIGMGLFVAIRACAQPSATFTVVEDWGAGFTGRIVIHNPTNQTLSRWTLDFDWDRKIETIWDATIAGRDGEHYQIRPVGWNAEIAPGASVQFGFNASPGGVEQGPERMVLGALPEEPPPVPAEGSIAVRIVQTAAYSGGFTANLIIQNSDTKAFPRWNLRFQSDRAISIVYNTSFSREGTTYFVSSSSSTIAPGTAATFTLTGTGSFSGVQFSDCVFNTMPCPIVAQSGGSATSAPSNPIVIDELDAKGEAVQATLSQGTTEMRLRPPLGGETSFVVITSNPAVATAEVRDNTLRITARSPGRTSVRIEERNSKAVRYLGLRVRDGGGRLPGLPRYLSLGSVSEDIGDHITFWEDFSDPARNKRMDIRYIYLNGGPFIGWDTWANGSGGRATGYIRHCKRLGMIPFFVFYNIPEGGESYETDLANVQNPAYMKAYFQNLKLALDIINQESPDDVTGMILEPDFLGYLAQNANAPASQIRAATNGVYESGVLRAGVDPRFPDTVKGLVEAINYVIFRTSPQVRFGWQLNLWASPPGGWTTSVPGRGLIRKTDTSPLPSGRDLVYREAAAITQYYLDAGIASHGASFLSIDKYGLDATGIEASAASDPASSTWFWNSDHWLNYLAFVRAMRDTSKLPVILWQLPVGRINSTSLANPYQPSGVFNDLPSTHQRYEDSAPSFFFGDTFTTNGARLNYFSRNQSQDPSLLVNGNRITWGSHMREAQAAGVISILFGAGVGQSTHGVGAPPPDGYWWITKAQSYYESPIPLP